MDHDPSRITPLDSFVSRNSPICYGILKPGNHVPGGVPVIKVKNIINGVVNERDLLQTSPEIHRQYLRSELKAGDLLLTIRGTTGRVAFVPPSLNGANITQDTARIRVTTEDSPTYLYYALQSSAVQRQIKLNTIGQAVKGINIAEVKKIKLFHPAKGKQEKIAKILSTWDKAIETTEKLIENSKAQKKALMQQLLVGKRKIPKSRERWSIYRLHEIADILVSNVDKKSHGEEIPISLCNYTDVYYNNYITNDLPFMVATATKREISKFTLQKGDVLITKDSESPDDIAISALVREELSGVLCGYHLAIVRPNQRLADGAFLNFLFSLKSVRHYFSTLANGATRFGLSIGSFKNAIFYIPRLGEQKRIASILMTQDDKISNLESQRRFLLHQKQALMQQLLTGKRPVKVNNTNATKAAC